MGPIKIIDAVKKNNLVNMKKALKLCKTDTCKAYDLNQAVQKNGRRLLHIAVQHGSDTVFLHLLREGADINIADTRGDTPAHYATLYGQPKILTLLKENGADFSRKNKLGDTFEQYINYKPRKEENKRIKKELESIILKKTDKCEILSMVSKNRLLPLAVENHLRQPRYKIVEKFAYVRPVDVAIERLEDRSHSDLKRKIRQQEEIVCNKKLGVTQSSFFKDISRRNERQIEPLNLIIHNRPLNLSIKSCFKK